MEVFLWSGSFGTGALSSKLVMERMNVVTAQAQPSTSIARLSILPADVSHLIKPTSSN